VFLAEPDEYDRSDPVTYYVVICGGEIADALGDQALEPTRSHP
jgi:hypothetical protein